MKEKKELKVELVRADGASDEEVNFRLGQALSILLDKQDILNYSKDGKNDEKQSNNH